MKIAVMLSGGVDSAVAALLLQRAGHEVTGVFMKNWEPLTSQSLTDCPWQADQEDAEACATKLGIPFRSVNFEQEYYDRVVKYLLAEYAAGRTPNPDILCNKEIKFGLFFDWAMDEGFEQVASGHYAQIVHREGRALVARGADPDKDQSYFLWTVPSDRLERVQWPVGALTKTEVRRLAKEAGLPVAGKADSQGICFIGHLGLADFLRSELHPEPGVVETLSGVPVGEHDGAILYTIGQRHGFTLTQAALVTAEYGGAAGSLPSLYVVGKRLVDNVIVVAPEESKPLHPTSFIVQDVAWRLPAAECREVDVQVRYRQQPVAARLSGEMEVRVELAAPVRAAASGQFAVFYRDNAVVGGGIIHNEA